MNEFQNIGEFIVKIPERNMGQHYMNEFYLTVCYQDCISYISLKIVTFVWNYVNECQTRKLKMQNYCLLIIWHLQNFHV